MTIEKASRAYVFHKHAATQLHYDFRLELGGVLLSWAVPKGPSLNPRDKRLAVQVGDHALSYATFEGKLSHGAVIIWDRGTWAMDDDADYTRGRMSFMLHGEKLRGRWHLVRRAKTKNWILFKGADAEAKRTGSIIEDQPRSVVSGLTLEEIMAG